MVPTKAYFPMAGPVSIQHVRSTSCRPWSRLYNNPNSGWMDGGPSMAAGAAAVVGKRSPCHLGKNKIRHFKPFGAKFFIRRHKNVSIIYIIPPSWIDTGSWNPSSCKTRSCLFCIVNIMAADGLATQGARASAAMLLTQLNQDNSVPAR